MKLINKRPIYNMRRILRNNDDYDYDNCSSRAFGILPLLSSEVK